MLRIALALFLLCAWTTHTVSAQLATVRYTVVLTDGKRVPLYAQRLRDRDYVSFAELATTVFRNGVVEKDGNGVRWQGELMRSASSSFYLSRSNKSGVRIAQMPYPTLAIGEKTCVPLLPLCSAVETLGLFAVEIQGSTIVLHKLSEHSPSAVLLPARKTPPAERSELVEADDEDYGVAEEENGSPKDIMTGLTPPEDNHGDAEEEESASVLPSGTMGKALAPFKRYAASVGSSVPVKQKVVPPQTEPREQHTSAPADAGQPHGKKQPEATREAPQQPSRKKDELQPNRYILPRGLYRRELIEQPEKKDSSHSLLYDTGSTLQPGPPLAYTGGVLAPTVPVTALAVSAFSDADVRIVAMDVAVGRGTVAVEIQGNTAISQYQRPEWTGKSVVLRFPAARNAIAAKALRQLGAIAPLTSVQSEQRGSMLVYTLSFASSVAGCSYARKSPTALVFTIAIPTGDTNGGTVANSEAKRWALDVIVLDAGHGGKDVGAIGVSGKYEKDITLALVKKLGALLQQYMPSTRVVYTRSDDRFVELYRRGQIANEAGGKLFISIHCNSMPTKPHPANGCETYILRPGRNDDAVRVAERENSAIKFESNQKRYQKLTDEQFIVVNMAQSAFVKFSEKFGSLVQQEVSSSTPLADRGVNQAGFYVLVGASMPNILFEAAFLSNADDEHFITSAKGQDAIAEGLFNAIRLYAEQYEQMIKTQK